ncbi:DUF2163 domain-containing protein [Aureimonas leprariae]|uniref:DUF2163 domain-containing protein n=1 Tax=Plantimonas leprariae TaxID=2615207 RepID=UPI00192A63FE|nr:DUF2163 domain-containing protein [Aureimonas leprariae]
MRSLPPQVLVQMDAGTLAMRGLMRFDLGSGTYGFWTGSEPLTYGGQTYLPGGVVQVDAIPGELGMDAQPLRITLAESPDDGLTPAVLATIEQEDYHQRPVTISDVFIDPDSRAIVHVEPVYRGYVDSIEHTDGPEAGLVAMISSRALDNAREGYRMRSSADQQLVLDGDKGFEHAEVAGKQEIYWGREKPK